MANDCALFTFQLCGNKLEEIRLGVNQGLAMGHDSFKIKIKALTCIKLKLKIAGGLSGLITTGMVLFPRLVFFPIFSSVIDGNIPSKMLVQVLGERYT